MAAEEIQTEKDKIEFEIEQFDRHGLLVERLMKLDDNAAAKTSTLISNSRNEIIDKKKRIDLQELEHAERSSQMQIRLNELKSKFNIQPQDETKSLSGKNEEMKDEMVIKIEKNKVLQAKCEELKKRIEVSFIFVRIFSVEITYFHFFSVRSRKEEKNYGTR